MVTSKYISRIYYEFSKLKLSLGDDYPKYWFDFGISKST